MDPKCPTVCIAWDLKKRKWNAVERRCDHTTDAITSYDAFEAVKLKSYYQVLLVLPRCLTQTSHVVSREPVLFYKLLLAGVTVEPGLSNKDYNILWDKHLKTRCWHWKMCLPRRTTATPNHLLLTTM